MFFDKVSLVACLYHLSQWRTTPAQACRVRVLSNKLQVLYNIFDEMSSFFDTITVSVSVYIPYLKARGFDGGEVKGHRHIVYSEDC